MPVVAVCGGLTPGAAVGNILTQDDGDPITLDDGTTIVVLDNS